MQTFLPYADFNRSVKVLDYKRLGKQRVEAYQILNTLTGKSKGWTNHPVTKMWRGYEDALKWYLNYGIAEWVERGYNNTMQIQQVPTHILKPIWLGLEELHSSHRSNLLRKDYEFYSKYGWKESTDLPYYWPV